MCEVCPSTPTRPLLRRGADDRSTCEQPPPYYYQQQLPLPVSVPPVERKGNHLKEEETPTGPSLLFDDRRARDRRSESAKRSSILGDSSFASQILRSSNDPLKKERTLYRLHRVILQPTVRRIRGGAPRNASYEKITRWSLNLPAEIAHLLLR